MITFQAFLDRVNFTHEEVAAKLDTNRSQLWRWRDYMVLEDGTMVPPKLLCKINLSDFKLDEIPTQD